MRQYPEKPANVYFFGTCLIDLFYPTAGMAGIKLLQREGINVVFPSDQSCCGQPAYNSGFPNEAKAVAKKQIDLFSRNYPIVVPSGSCAAMMRYHYPKLFGTESNIDRVNAFSERVFELSEFLVHVLNIRLDDQGEPIKVTWHSSCHAMREMGITKESKSLIQQLGKVELIELQNEPECCGFGGTFAIKQPAISEAMVQDKVEDILKTGASRVITGDCGCLMNIVGAMQHLSIGIEGQHLAEFIWERINGGSS